MTSVELFGRPYCRTRREMISYDAVPETNYRQDFFLHYHGSAHSTVLRRIQQTPAGNQAQKIIRFKSIFGCSVHQDFQKILLKVVY